MPWIIVLRSRLLTVTLRARISAVICGPSFVALTEDVLRLQCRLLKVVRWILNYLIHVLNRPSQNFRTIYIHPTFGKQVFKKPLVNAGKQTERSPCRLSRHATAAALLRARRPVPLNHDACPIWHRN
ncbi:hypothetical protein A0H81_05936 [Grifola frondosa]|uniref:Secreted protein n=1 Tax=Grifola frondosa TaxID=5627 RepID=A0A1C7MAY0_GRIFR|nr:hypothetical protein A0H81_05936 [Grifola frondosa]